MATYNRPGVFINELPLQAAPVNTAAAANAAGAVVAAFPQGPDVVTKVTSWYEFAKKFGGYSAAYPATFSVGSFFKNGGTELYVKRVLPASSKKVAKVDILTNEKHSTGTIAISKVAKADTATGIATITTGSAHGLETGDRVTVTGLVNTTGDTPIYYADLNVSDAAITVTSSTKFTYALSGAHTAAIVEAPVTGATVVGSSISVVCTIAAKHRGSDGNSLRVVLSDSTSIRESGYYDLTVYQDAGTSDYVNGAFTPANAGDDVMVEQFNGVVLNDPLSGDYIVNVVEFGSSYIRVLEGAVTEYDEFGAPLPVVTYTVDGVNAPDVDTYYALAGAPSPEAALHYGDYTGNYFVEGTGGDPDTGFDPADSLGSFSVADCELFKEFESIDQPLVFFLPDVNAKVTDNDDENVGWSLAKFVYNALIEWVEAPQTNGRHFVLVEGAGGETVDDAVAESGDLEVSSRAGYYYPQVYIKDPIGRSSSSIRKIGPTGGVAGLFLYTDRLAGPFKAPAGVSTKLVDAIALERAFSPLELDALNTGINSAGVRAGMNVVNAIRNIPGAGVVVMGARTLKQDGTANRYINMRRSLTYIEKRLNDLASFAVFENNTETLWARLITVLGVFLNEYRNQGGLRGTTVDSSFYIKCDEENNTPETIAAGEVHVEIGVALEYPAEFVVINLSQKTAE